MNHYVIDSYIANELGLVICAKPQPEHLNTTRRINLYPWMVHILDVPVKGLE